MTSSELELAQNYLTLSKRVYDTKKGELAEAMALVARLEVQVSEAARDWESAEATLQRVERQLQVVEIDEDENKENRDPRVGLPLVPTHPMRTQDNQQSRSRRRQDARENDSITQMDFTELLFGDKSADHNISLPASLRRSLQRHRRKIVRLAEKQHGYRNV